MCYSIPNFTAKSLILDQLDILKSQLHDQQQHFYLITPLQNSLACARRVVNSTAMDPMTVRMSNIELKQWKRMCMLLVAFIMQYVSGCRSVT